MSVTGSETAKDGLTTEDEVEIVEKVVEKVSEALDTQLNTQFSKIDHQLAEQSTINDSLVQTLDDIRSQLSSLSSHQRTTPMGYGSSVSTTLQPTILGPNGGLHYTPPPPLSATAQPFMSTSTTTTTSSSSSTSSTNDQKQASSTTYTPTQPTQNPPLQQLGIQPNNNASSGQHQIGSTPGSNLLPTSLQLPSYLTITGQQLLDHLPEKLSMKPNPFMDFIEIEQPKIEYNFSWPIHTEKTIMSSNLIKKTKVVIKSDPHLYVKWEEYTKDVLIACYLTILTNMSHHVVPRTRAEWSRFDTNCKTLRTYHEAVNLTNRDKKIPKVLSDAHIVTQNCICLAILELFPAMVNFLYITIRDSIDSTTLRSIRGEATNEVDFISIRLMYFGVKNNFLQSTVATNRRRKLLVLSGSKMGPLEKRNLLISKIKVLIRWVSNYFS